jgi:hypothetical protein
MIDPGALAKDLDAVHSRARACYQAKDLGGFMTLYAADLRYKQPDGKTIGWDQLAHDVSAQFMVIDRAETTYVRESLVVDDDTATETLQQTATITMRHWIFFKRTWHLSRRGQYVWKRTCEGWKVHVVEVLSETVRRGSA